MFRCKGMPDHLTHTHTCIHTHRCWQAEMLFDDAHLWVAGLSNSSNTMRAQNSDKNNTLLLQFTKHTHTHTQQPNMSVKRCNEIKSFTFTTIRVCFRTPSGWPTMAGRTRTKYFHLLSFKFIYILLLFSLNLLVGWTCPGGRQLNSSDWTV